MISLAFSPDGAHVATGDADGMLRFWSTAAGTALGVPVRLHADSVRSLAFSADGKQLVALDVDGMGRAWPAPAAWAAELCAKLTRNMSRRQWNAWISSEIPYREQCPGLPVPP